MASNKIRGNVLSAGNGVAAYAEIPNGDGTYTYIEMGTLVDIQFGSSRMIGAVHSNGSSAARGHDRGRRLSQGTAEWATIGEKTIMKIYEAIKGKKQLVKNFVDTDIDVSALGAGVEGLLESGIQSEEGGNHDVSISLYKLPPINLVLTAKADVIRQLGLDDSLASKLSYTQAVRYNKTLQRRINNIKFTSEASGLSGKTGFESEVSEFIVLGSVGSWKLINE